MTEERKHAKLGGSGAHRWANCPGSVTLVDKLPPEPQSQAASDGTRRHDVCEAKLKAFIHYKLTGETIQLPQFQLEDEEMADAYVKYIWEDVLECSVTGKAWGTEDMFAVDESLGMFGYVDFWCAYTDDKGLRHGKVVDLKTGYHYVPAKKNYQMAFYADGLRVFLRDNGKDLDLVDCCIYQPRTEWEPSRCTTYTSKQLDIFHKRFMDAAHAIYVTKRPRFKCGDWCEFCPALGVCPKYGKELEKSSSLRVVNVDQIQLPEPERLSDEQLAKICKHGSSIEGFIRAVRAHVINRHINGSPVSGLKVVEGTSRRKWLDDEDKVAKELGVLGFDPWRQKLCTITEAEKKLGKDSIKGLTTFTQASPVIVPEDDKRESLLSYFDKLE